MHFRKNTPRRGPITFVVALAVLLAGVFAIPSGASSLSSVKAPTDVPPSVAALAEPPLPYEGGGALEQARSSAKGTRVLFVGNSFVHRNNMVAMLNEISRRDNTRKKVFAVQFAPPESTLAQKVDSPSFDELLHAAPWDVVVLQEQSKIPSFPDAQRRAQMDPAVQRLHAKIAAVGADTKLFMTWGYRDGDDINVPNDTYEAMQSRLANGYLTVGREQHIPVVPIDLAWSEAHATDPSLELWFTDGVHPSQLGSYYVAQLFYKALTGRNPPAITG